MDNGVTVITPTGNREKTLSFCQKYILRQNYKGPIQWIIVDDGTTQNSIQSFKNVYMTQIRPRVLWKLGDNTLARNLLLAIPEVIYDKILFCEDDDWYSSHYIESMFLDLHQFDLVGETPSRYYFVPDQKYRLMGTYRRASLCQTGIRSEFLPILKSICEESPDYIDVRLWEKFPARKKLLFSHLVVGMKGLPGRKGIGVGHDRESPYWNSDYNCAFLRAWIGKDVELYKEFMK